MQQGKTGLYVSLLVALSVGLLGLLFERSRFSHGGRAAHSHKLAVTADFYPMAEFARRVGRDHVQVRVLVKPGNEPHDFEPLPNDLATMEQSRVFVFNGASMDPWSRRVIPDLSQDNVAIVNSSAGIPLLTESGSGSAPAAANPDPHVWLDPLLAKREVDNIAAGFARADPTHRHDYTANAAEYKAKLDRLDVDFRTGLASCVSRDIVTSHAAFQYLARRYGLNQVAIAGLSPDEEPSPRRLADIARFVQAHHVHYIFFETLVSPRLAQTIASETGAQTLVLNPIESLTSEELAKGDDYLSVQRQNLHNLRIALECR